MSLSPRRTFSSSFAAGPVTADDEATLYALNVAEGRILASEHVVKQCERHMADLEAGVYQWRPGYVDNGHMAWFTTICDAVPVTVRGRIQPMVPDGWQHFIIASVLGWQCRADNEIGRMAGTRRFSRATIMAGKNSGKTQLLSVLGIFMLTADYWEGPDGVRRRSAPKGSEYFAIATNEEQAQSLVMKPIADLLDDHPELAENLGLETIGGKDPNRIYHAESRTYMKAAGSRRGGLGKSGLQVQYIHAEELHEWPHSEHLEMLEAGFKQQVQPLLVTSTNAGKGKKGIVWEEYRNAMAAARGDVGFDMHFAYLAEVDKAVPNEVDPDTGSPLWFPAQEYWIQAVPSLDSFSNPVYLRERVAGANTEQRRNEVDRLNFGRWGTHSSALFDPYQWERAQHDDFELPDPDDGWVFVGIDMGRTNDMTAVALLFRPKRGPMRAMVRYWVAGTTLQDQAERLSGDLLDWVKDGWVFANDLPVQDYLEVGRWLEHMLEGRKAKLCADPKYMDIAMPIWRTHGLPFKMEGEYADGWEVKWWPQNNPEPKPGVLSMDMAIEALVTSLVGGTLKIERNPTLDWNLACVEVHSGRRDMRTLVRAPDKRDSDKIDGMVALAEAAGLEASDRRVEPSSFYDDPSFTLNE